MDKHFFEQIFRNVEPESFLYEFLNSGDPLYSIQINQVSKNCILEPGEDDHFYFLGV